MKRIISLFIYLLLTIIHSNAQLDSLKAKIQNCIKGNNAEIGVAINAYSGNDSLSINGREHLPMQSVYKFPIALAVLSAIDKGKFTWNQKIVITKKDLLPNTWSPLREKYPNGAILPIGEIIKYMVSQSDNNGCDILLRLLGGPDFAEKFLRQNQIEDVSIKATEEEMHKDLNTQFSNWTTPLAMNKLLIKYFFSNKLLSKKSHNFLWDIMTQTSTGANRLKAQLPRNAIVAHKTGTSFTDSSGVTAATNDVGIIMLPNQKKIFISVFVSSSKENAETNEKIIADISKTTWDYFMTKKQ